MQAINNGPSPWSHESSQWGLIQLKLQREREEERKQAQKSEIDRFHEEALRRFWERSSQDQHMTFGR